MAKGEKVDYRSVLDNVMERDYRDTHRKESPLVRAKDAKLLDNSLFDIELQQKVVMNWFESTVKFSCIIFGQILTSLAPLTRPLF